MIQRSKRQQFLQTLSWFSEWSYVKLLELNSHLNEVNYLPDDVVYDIGQDPDVFYILRSGRLTCETVIEVEDYKKYPTVRITTKNQGAKEWEILVTKRKILYKMKELKPG